MKVLLLFLFVAFVLGLRSAAADKKPIAWVLVVLAFVVGASFTRLGVI